MSGGVKADILGVWVVQRVNNGDVVGEKSGEWWADIVMGWEGKVVEGRGKLRVYSK